MAFEFSLFGERYMFSFSDDGKPLIDGLDEYGEMCEDMAQAYCNALSYDIAAEYAPNIQWMEYAYANALGATPPIIDTSHDPRDAIF